jgi:hypothetical protein
MDEATKAMYEYLTKLRDGGTINMWGASCQLQEEFELDQYKAKEVHLAWMDWCKKTIKEN